jgi:hypothetical protein
VACWNRFRRAYSILLGKLRKTGKSRNDRPVEYCAVPAAKPWQTSIKRRGQRCNARAHRSPPAPFQLALPVMPDSGQRTPRRSAFLLNRAQSLRAPGRPRPGRWVPVRDREPQHSSGRFSCANALNADFAAETDKRLKAAREGRSPFIQPTARTAPGVRIDGVTCVAADAGYQPWPPVMKCMRRPERLPAQTQRVLEDTERGAICPLLKRRSQHQPRPARRAG